MRSRSPAGTLVALLILSLIGVHGYAGTHSYPDTDDAGVAASPSTAALDTAASSQSPARRGVCSPTRPNATRHAVQVKPLVSAHAHNDYDHCRPLYDALDRGFTSVEADVWLVDGRLLVGHDREDVMSGRSLEDLYLAPLEALTRKHAGQVYPGGQRSLRLLIDVKSEAAPAYAALEDLLRRHHRIMTSFTDRRTIPRAVTAIVSGHQDRHAIRSSPVRYAAYEGGPGDLRRSSSPSFMPTVAADWQENFSWDGVGDMPALEELRLRGLVTEAHALGRTMRFWGTPDHAGAAREAVWSMLLDAGVDQISTDDLAELATYLARHAAPQMGHAAP